MELNGNKEVFVHYKDLELQNNSFLAAWRCKIGGF
ncbi:MAG: hypothetical protein JWP81_2013 [Ferruginibacter sp.]|nr:hypothetical protein [Ferruginibacter sp.]